jgi:hypothetical protein
MSSNTGLKVRPRGARRAAGQRRLSLARAAWTGFIRAARLMAQEGSFAGFDGTISFAELNGFFRDDLKDRAR